MNLQPASVPGQRTIDGLGFPLVLIAEGEPAVNAAAARQWISENKQTIHQRLIEHGAVLLRDFAIRSATEFEAFLDQTDYKNMPYVGGAAPRLQVTKTRIVTANEAPASEKIPFHHEMAQVPDPPGYIFFFCETAADTGGATSILHSAEICRRLFEIDPDFAKKIETEGVQYIRVMPEKTDDSSPIGRSWKETFQVDNKAEAEQKMSLAGMSFEWLADNSVRTTTSVLPAIKVDPESGQKVFFNSIVAVFTGWTDSRNQGELAVITPDGEPMNQQTIQKLSAEMDRLCVNFAWQPGDLLMLNNYTVLHARQPYEGARRILAAIAYK